MTVNIIVCPKNILIDFQKATVLVMYDLILKYKYYIGLFI